MVNSLKKSSPQAEDAAEDKNVIGEDLLFPENVKISGIRELVRKETAGPAPVVIIPGYRTPAARQTVQTGEAEENVIVAEGDLRVITRPGGSYKSVQDSPCKSIRDEKQDDVRKHHEELCLRYPDHYRRMCLDDDGKVVTLQSQKDTAEPHDTISPPTDRHPPLSTLGDDDDTPRIGKKFF